MGDKPGGAKKLDLTPLFFLFLLCIIIGLGTVQLPGSNNEGEKESAEGGQMTMAWGGGCEQGSGCGGVQPEPKMIYNRIDTTIEYTVQVACFKEKKEAYWEAGRMRASQINNFVMEHRGAWYVCVGRFTTKQRAQRRAQQLIEYGVSQAVVFPPGDPCVGVPPPDDNCPYCFIIFILVFIIVIVAANLSKSALKP